MSNMHTFSFLFFFRFIQCLIWFRRCGRLFVCRCRAVVPLQERIFPDPGTSRTPSVCNVYVCACLSTRSSMLFP